MRSIAGRPVSLVGLGCNNFGMRTAEDQAKTVVQAALDAGINFFDTADIYGGTLSEEILGRALAGHRDEAIIATKFGVQTAGEGTGGGSARWVRQAADDSLRRLGVDVIDLYQYHFPDPTVPLAETMGAMQELVTAGKVLAIGCSNFTGAMVDEAAAISSDQGISPFVTAQNNFSIINQEGIVDDLLPACDRHGLSVLPWFPLASGLLTGKYKRGQAPPEGTRMAGTPEERREAMLNDANFDKVERLEAWAAARDHTILELAFAWLAAFPEIDSIIAGATRPEQVKANVAAVAWTLTPAERDEVAALGR